MSALIDMYITYGRIHNAQELFYKMHNTIIVSWFVMVAWYKKWFFFKTITSICNGFAFNIVFVSALIYMYVKYRRIYKDQELFNKMHDSKKFLSCKMITGYR